MVDLSSRLVLVYCAQRIVQQVSSLRESCVRISTQMADSSTSTRLLGVAENGDKSTTLQTTERRR